MRIDTAGIVSVAATTAATSKVTGSLINAGGLGNAGAIYTDTLNLITLATTSQTNVLCYNTTTGLVTTTTQTTNCLVSSAEYKDNIVNIPDAEAFKVAVGLQPVAFTYKPSAQMDSISHIGFTAEQVAEVAPELVEYSVYGTGRKPHAVKYGELSPIWAGAFRQVSANFEQLSLRVQKLEMQLH